MDVIEIRDLHKAFGDYKIYTGLNMTVKEGEIVVIIGGSGCGKSVLLRSIEMLEKPDSGQIFIDGQEITAEGADIGKIRRSMGMVYQDFALFSNMNVMENLCIAPMKLLGMSQEDAEKKALELLATVGLADKANRRVQALSGGQKQRIAICRSMMMDPKIILFDEPTSALDPTMVGEVLATIRLLSRRGLTMMIVTHEMNFARQIADRIVFLADGGIYEQGTPEEIFENPQREKTIDFIRKMKHTACEITSKEFDLIEIHGVIQQFAMRYGLSNNESYRLQICTEEMIYAMLSRLPDDNVNIKINVGFSEDDRSCELTFISPGPEFDPAKILEASDDDAFGDSLGLMIILKKSKEYEHSYTDGVNTIKLKL